MSLTVPVAGTTAGRAAQVRFEAPQTGAVLSAFGDTVKQVGDRIEAERLDLEMGRLQVDMTRDLGELRRKYEAMGDPDAIDAGWARDMGALKQSYLTGQTDAGRPRVDPKLRARWELGFDDLAEKHAFALGTTVMAIRRSQRLATHIEYEATASREAAATDAGTRETIYAQNDERLAALEASGDMTPEAAAAARLRFRQDGDFNAAVNDLASDPELVREGLAGGLYPDLTPEQRARVEASLAAADEKARVLADKASADRLAGLKTDLTEGIALVRDGRISPAEALVDNPVMQAEFPEMVAEMRGAIGLREARVDINRMTLDQLEATRDQWAGQGFSRKWQAEGLKVIEARIAEVRTAQRADPVALWKTSGLGLSDIDFTSDESLAQSLAQRATDVERLGKSGHLKAPVFLDKEEAAEIRERAAPANDPAARLALAMRLQGAFAGKDANAVEAITGDRTLAGVAGMLAGGAGNSVLARQILQGQRIAAEKGMTLPSEGSWRGAITARFGGLFADGTGAAGDENATLAMLGDMAFGLYVQRKGAEADLAGSEIDTAVLNQAVHEIMGGAGTYGGGTATGGVQEVEGVQTILPPGMRAADIEDGWAILKQSVRYGPNRQVGSVDPDRLWRALSASGNVPRIAGQPLDDETMATLHFKVIDSGAGYALVRPNEAGDEQLFGDDGLPFLLDLDALTRVEDTLRRIGGAP